jgi:extracellular factor (EF) 3-hydroxypalmitic acid methyl ester biosynthesis protein
MERHINFIKSLVARGGPKAEDYRALDGWLSAVWDDIELGLLRGAEFDALLTQFGEMFQTSTMQGFARCKPHGYSGDFEIIDRIYRGHTAADAQLANWDHTFTPKAHRERSEIGRRTFTRCSPKRNVPSQTA